MNFEVMKDKSKIKDNYNSKTINFMNEFYQETSIINNLKDVKDKITCDKDYIFKSNDYFLKINEALTNIAIKDGFDKNNENLEKYIINKIEQLRDKSSTEFTKMSNVSFKSYKRTLHRWINGYQYNNINKLANKLEKIGLSKKEFLESQNNFLMELQSKLGFRDKYNDDNTRNKSFIQYIEKKLNNADIELSKEENNLLLQMLNGKNKNDRISTPQGSYSEETKELAYVICFAFKLDEKDSKEFMQKTLFLPAFNNRNLKDFVYYYHLKNKLSYKDAVIALDKINNNRKELDTDNLIYEKKENMTKFVYEEAIQFEQSKNGIYDFFDKYQMYFQYKSSKVQSETIKRNLCILFDELKKQNQKNFNKSNTISAESLMKEIFGIHRDYKFIENLNPVFTDAFPNRNYVRQIYNYANNICEQSKVPSDTSIRKLIIALVFYITFFDIDENKNFIDLYNRFESYVNAILVECGYPTLYVRNPYDYIFISVLKYYCNKENYKKIIEVLKEFISCLSN